MRASAPTAPSAPTAWGARCATRDAGARRPSAGPRATDARPRALLAEHQGEYGAWSSRWRSARRPGQIRANEACVRPFRTRARPQTVRTDDSDRRDSDLLQSCPSNLHGVAWIPTGSTFRSASRKTAHLRTGLRPRYHRRGQARIKVPRWSRAGRFSCPFRGAAMRGGLTARKAGARLPPRHQRRASMIKLKEFLVATRTSENPALLSTFDSLAKPAWAPSE
jgi:hypothetical protein